MTERELLLKIYNGEFALFIVLGLILMLLGILFGNRGGK